MKHLFTSVAMVSALAGCALFLENDNAPADVVEKPIVETSNTPVSTPVEALRAYYKTIPDEILPVAPKGPELDATKPISRVVFGSCLDEDLEAPALNSMASEGGDVVLLIGDNIYADVKDGAYHENGPDLEGVRAGYEALAKMPEFVQLRETTPMLVTWDDHDYGANDNGGEFLFKEFSERIYERFWGLEDTDVADHPGVYTSVMTGPDGQRLQLIVTDTRFFRTELTPTDEYGAKGKERYLPSQDPNQNMLGDAQWAWLEEELKKPADLRLFVSSIQVIPTVHGWEAWSSMPKERERLFDLLKETGATNTVFLSGDRHTAFLYNDEDNTVGPLREITASSINKSFADNPVSDEVDAKQSGDGYTFTNYGVIDIDWESKTVTLSVKDDYGHVKNALSFDF